MKQSLKLGKGPRAHLQNTLNGRLFDIIGMGWAKLA
jgi:hypothetical protein